MYEKIQNKLKSLLTHDRSNWRSKYHRILSIFLNKSRFFFLIYEKREYNRKGKTTGYKPPSSYEHQFLKIHTLRILKKMRFLDPLQFYPTLFFFEISKNLRII